MPIVCIEFEGFVVSCDMQKNILCSLSLCFETFPEKLVTGSIRLTGFVACSLQCPHQHCYCHSTKNAGRGNVLTFTKCIFSTLIF